MLRSFVINKYISIEFLKISLNMVLIFFSLGFVLNLFEEINFFKDFNIAIHLPVFMTILIVPSLLYNMFPFIMLLSGIWFFFKNKKK